MGGSESVPDIPGDLPPFPGELPDVQNITLPNPEDLEIFQDVQLDYFDLELPEPPDIELTFEDFIGEELPSDLGTFLEETLEAAIEIGVIEPNVTFSADCICDATGNAAVFNVSEIFAQFCPTVQDVLDYAEDEADELDYLDLEVTCEADELPEELTCGDILQLEVIFSNEIEGPCVDPGEDSLLNGFESIFNITEFSELLEERCCTDAPPSSEPTPALQPTISEAPTMGPSPSPSTNPTVSFMPTYEPSYSPSTYPSPEASAVPTASPTLTPTLAPSSLPSLAPSKLPSEAPSFSDEIVITVTVQLSGITEEEFNDPDVQAAFRRGIANLFPGLDEDDIIIRIVGLAGGAPARRLSLALRHLQDDLEVEFDVVARVSEVEVDGENANSNTALFDAMSSKMAEAAESGELDTALQDESDAFDSASVNADSLDITASGGVPESGGGGGGGGGDTAIIAGVVGGVGGVLVIGGIATWYFLTKGAVTPGPTSGVKVVEAVPAQVPYNT